MNFLNGTLPIYAIAVIVLIILYYLRNLYYSSPTNRLKWHRLNATGLISEKLGPQPVNLAKGLTPMDVARSDTLELINNSLVIKLADGKITEINLNDITKVESSSPAELVIYPIDMKFLSLLNDKRIGFYFGKSVVGSVLWTSWGGFKTLPLRWLAFTAHDRVQADKKALEFYVNISRSITENDKS